MSIDSSQRVPAVADRSTMLAEQRTALSIERSFLAFERTLMAWLRTSLSMIGFGFTLAKFFAYLEQQKGGAVVGRFGRTWASDTVGLAMIAIGTVALVILMTIAVVPVGVMTAIYLGEYTTGTSPLTRIIRLAINNLAGVPSIVFGLFGLGFFIGFVGNGMDKLLTDGTSPVWGQPAIIWASLTMALLTLPVVIISTEEALRTIPRELKEASYALGATKLQTIVRIIIPQAMPGILTGAILAVSRGASTASAPS